MEIEKVATYTITLDADEYRNVIEALDWYSRASTGPTELQKRVKMAEMCVLFEKDK